MRHVDKDRCSIVVRNRRSEDIAAKNERMVNGVGIEIFWILEPEWVENGGSIDVRLVESSVEIAKQSVPEKETNALEGTQN